LSRDKILIVHPSRERAQLAQKVFWDTISTSEYPNNILYTFALDKDDPQLARYVNDTRISYCNIEDNKCIVDAVNKIYPYFLEHKDEIKFVIILSDDMVLCDNWDIVLTEQFEKYGYDKALQTTQPKGNPNLLTLPICGYRFFLDYGTFYYPKYKSMFADDDMTQWAIKNNCYMRVPHIVCPHLHPSLDIPNKITIDTTYHRENNNEFAEIGRAVFKQRQQEGFPAYHG
jgi:hypothetical protein